MNSDLSPNTTARHDANIADKWKNLGAKVPFAAAASDGGQPAETPAQQSNENVGQQAVSSTEQPNSHLGEEEKQQLRQRLEWGYTVNFRKVVRNFYDDDPDDFEVNKNNPDSYTTLMALEWLIPEQHQLEMIREFCETGNIKETLSYEEGEKEINVANVLADVVCNSQFADEVYRGDVFLRQRRADYQAGRRDFLKDSDRNEGIVWALWAMDPNFEGSKEAKALITDPGYLRLTYGQAIENDLLGENGKAPGGSSTYEQEMSSRVEQLGKMLQSDIDDGAFTAGDILHDPFQRRRRIENIQSANSVPTPTASIEELWRLDVSFYDSPELVGFLNRVRSKNPDIFNVNRDEVNRRINRVIEWISDKDFRAIANAYKSDYHGGDTKVVRILTPILGMGDMFPNIIYSDDVSASAEAKYCDTADRPHTIVYYEARNIQFNHADVADRIDSFAHEMYHAYQTHGQGIDPVLREQYGRNDANYVQSELDYYTYRNQLEEVETFAFGEAFQKKFNEIINSKKGVSLWSKLKAILGDI